MPSEIFVKMSKYLILILGCLLSVLSSSFSDEVPSMAISCGKTPLTALPKYQHSMDSFGFTNLLESLWDEGTKVVMVLQDELSLEDFTVKDTNGQNLFKVFENTEESRFFPSVDQPEKAVEMLSKNGFYVRDYNDDTSVNGSKKMIALVDLNENNHNNNDDRHSMLLKNNDNISNIFNHLCKQYTNVVLVFSGKLNPWIKKTEESNARHFVTRHLMAADSAPEPLKIVDPKGKSLIYSASYPTLSINNSPDTQLKGSNTEVFIDDSRDSLLKVGTTFLANESKVTLRFRFERQTFSWELKSIEFDNGNSNVLLIPNQPIGAQKGLSYFSEGPVIFSDDTIVLKFNNKFQVQPWLTKSTGEAKFSDPQEQDSFFTPPILAGLFVSFLMLFIVTWGITMIMDIKTMDTFDDPKGKTITINVAE